MIKRIGAAAAWVIIDTARNTYNPNSAAIYPNDSAAETTKLIDVTSNGFKINTDHSEVNGTTDYLYAAFAEHPFGGSNVSPSPAR
jgi:hypothetical protein